MQGVYMQFPTVGGPSYPSGGPVNPVDHQDNNSRAKRSRDGEEENTSQERPRLVMDKVRLYKYQAVKVIELSQRCCRLLPAEEVEIFWRNMTLIYLNNVPDEDAITEIYITEFYKGFLTTPLLLIQRKLPQDQPALLNECRELITMIHRIEEAIVNHRLCTFLNAVEPLLRP